MVVSALSHRLLDSVSKAALAAAILAAPSGASAAACDWAGGTGLWTTGGSWSCGAEPGSADAVAIITAGSVVSISGINANAGTIDLENANQLNITNSNLAIFGGSVIDNGTITVAANSRLQSGSGPLSITGSGTLVLDNSSGFAHLFESGGINTLGSGLTVRGSGQIGLNNAVIVNNGLISADVGGGMIEIDAAGGNGGLGGGGVGTGNNAGLLNNATMQASNGGVLGLDGGLYENGANGLILANAGSTVSLNGDSRVLNGTLQSIGTGVISASGANQYLQNVTLAAGSNLSIVNDNLQANTSLVNNGTITLGAASRLQSEAGQALSITGTGTIVLNNSANYAHLFENGGIMTLGAGQTVVGTGNIGLNDSVIVNNNVINANVNGGVLEIDAAGGNGGVGMGNGVGTNTNSGFLNKGTLEATNGGILFLDGGLYENAGGGVIKAGVGSTVDLNGDSRILNGTIESVGTGVISASGATQYLQGVTLGAGSTLNITNDNLLVNTSLVNNGTITVGPNGRLQSEGGQNITISGTGTIILDAGAGFSHLFESGGFITLGSNQTITGTGDIGLNAAAITNNNVFTFNNSSNVQLDVAGGNGGIAGGLGASGKAAFLNNGTVSVDGSSVLSIEGGYYDNSPGKIAATNGSTIDLDGDSRVVGGTLSADATSVINADNATQFLQNVTLAGGSNLSVINDNLQANTSLVNNGTITLGAASRLQSEAGQALSITGTGTIVLDNSKNYSHLFENGGIMTLGAGQTVVGAGNIGLNDSVIVNNSVINANVNGSVLDIDPAGGNGGVGMGNGVGTNTNSSFLNKGTLEATNGGILQLEGGLYENAGGGVIKAAAGSAVDLINDSRVLNGTIESVGTGAINADNGTQYLQNVTLAAGSNLSIVNDNLQANTSLVNNGTITLGAASRLQSEGGQNLSITGTGTIVLDNSVNYAHLFENGGIMTLGAGQTVVGSGLIGVNGPVIVNNGLINANVATGQIEIDAAGGNGGLGGGGVGTGNNSAMLNTGTLEATNGGTLSFDGGLYENSANGLITAAAGSVVALNGDSRILGGTLQSVGTGVINAHGANQFLQNVTLAGGSNLSIVNDNLQANTSLVNNGTITLGAASRLQSEANQNLSITGTGTIVLDNSVNYAHLFENGGIMTLGAGQTVVGSGLIGVNGPVIVNNGVINANVASGQIEIDAAGGNGGLGGGGVGTGNNSAMLNTGTLEATNGGTLSFDGGLYENSASGTMAANTGSTVVMNGDASLFNLQSGGVLNKGGYASTTTGAQSTLALRSNAANGIVTIGTATGTGTDTIVTLSGANSVLEVTPFGGGTPATIDSTLTGVAASGELQLLNGRNFTVTAGGGAFSNAGIVQLGASTFGATSYTNSGTTFGNGAVTVAIANTGTVNATGGTLATQAITGTTGTISTDPTGTLNLGGASTAGFLTNNGQLDLNTNNITVTSDYQNANFGSGNAFFGHANVSGSGLIFAASATMDLSGPAFSGGNLNVGNVRTGGSSSTTLTITNNGTLTILRGAVQDTNAPSITLTNANFVLNPNGGSSTATVSYTGTMAGSLAGQTLDVVNNFDNVAAKTINLQGNVYQVAVAASQPTMIKLAAQRVGGGPSTSTISIGNVAPNTPNFTESLSATASTTSPFALNGGPAVTTSDLAATQSQNVTLSLGTGAAGAFSGMVNIANTSIPVAGSGFAPLALAGQTINVSGNVYGVAVANLSGNTVNFGVVRQGTANVTGGLTVTNGAIGSLTDNLSTTIGATPAGISTTGTPGSLAQNQSGAASFLLDTSTAGQVGGSTTLGFTSTDTELAPLALASQTVNFTGTVTELAQALLQMTGGAGTFAGSGTSYTLNLGTITAGTGSLSTNFDVLNNIPNSSFAELLGGSFAGGTKGGFTFTGPSFSGVAGGQASSPDLLDFTFTGLGAGTYTDVITLDAFSHFDGLTDESLAPITLSVTADIKGMKGAVPEPATWAEMLLGFGFLGGVLRRRAKARAKARVAA